MIPLQPDKDGLQIYLGRTSQPEKAALMSRILAALPDSDHLQFLIWMSGLEATLDDVLKDIPTQNYRYDREETGRFFPKKLACLRLWTHRKEDMVTLTTYFGALNEGYIHVDVLDSGEEVDISTLPQETLEAYVLPKRRLALVVEPDGDLLQVRDCREAADLHAMATACLLASLKNNHFITPQEDEALYLEQQKLLAQVEAQPGPEPLLRLALLLDFPPIADYESAIELLWQTWLQFQDARAILLGAYMGLMEGAGIGASFSTVLQGGLPHASPKLQACGAYLLAKQIQMWSTGETAQAVALLERSISLCPDTVTPYLDLAQLRPRQREMLLETARTKVQQVYTVAQLEGMPLEALLSPDGMIDEILGIQCNELTAPA